MEETLARIKDYLIDTLIVNLTSMSIIVPWYYFTGMPMSSIEKVIFAYFTIGWFQALPTAIILRWFRARIKYSRRE